MKPLYKLYKKIISESEEDISLDFAEDIDETYIELSRHEVENIFNEELNEKYENMLVNVDGEDITIAEIIHDMRPELYKREFDDSFYNKNTRISTSKELYLGDDNTHCQDAARI